MWEATNNKKFSLKLFKQLIKNEYKKKIPSKLVKKGIKYYYNISVQILL